jgi:hypothetical protein
MKAIPNPKEAKRGSMYAENKKATASIVLMGNDE